jgi:hypothetical protein
MLYLTFTLTSHASMMPSAQRFIANPFTERTTCSIFQA